MELPEDTQTSHDIPWRIAKVMTTQWLRPCWWMAWAPSLGHVLDLITPPRSTSAIRFTKPWVPDVASVSSMEFSTSSCTLLAKVKPFNLPQTTHNKGDFQASKPISLHGHFPTCAFAKGCDFTWASKAVEWNVRLAVQRAARLCQWIHLGLRGSSFGSSGLWRDATSALATCRIFLARGTPWEIGKFQTFSAAKWKKRWLINCREANPSHWKLGWLWVWLSLETSKNVKNFCKKNRPDAVRPPESCTSDEPLPIHLQLGQVAKWQRRCPDDGPGWRPHVPCLQGSGMKCYE